MGDDRRVDVLAVLGGGLLEDEIDAVPRMELGQSLAGVGPGDAAARLG